MLQADMNFTIESVLSEPCNYGTFVEADNTSTGLLKPLTEGRADLTPMMYTDHLRLQAAHFVLIRQDHLKLISGKAREPSSTSILAVFAADYWTGLLVFVLANGLLMVMFSVLSKPQTSAGHDQTFRYQPFQILKGLALSAGALFSLDVSEVIDANLKAKKHYRVLLFTILLMGSLNFIIYQAGFFVVNHKICTHRHFFKNNFNQVTVCCK